MSKRVAVKSIKNGYDNSSVIGDNYQLLACAIVKQAADDYEYYAKKWHKSRKALAKRSQLSKEDREEIKFKHAYWESRLREVEKFLSSQWCAMLIDSSTDTGVYIRDKLIRKYQTEDLKRR